MTRWQFVMYAKYLMHQTDQPVAFRARPGPRTLRRFPACTVVYVDLSKHGALDMREGLAAALRPTQRL